MTVRLFVGSAPTVEGLRSYTVAGSTPTSESLFESDRSDRIATSSTGELIAANTGQSQLHAYIRTGGSYAEYNLTLPSEFSGGEGLINVAVSEDGTRIAAATRPSPSGPVYVVSYSRSGTVFTPGSVRNVFSADRTQMDYAFSGDGRFCFVLSKVNSANRVVIKVLSFDASTGTYEEHPGEVEHGTFYQWFEQSLLASYDGSLLIGLGVGNEFGQGCVDIFRNSAIAGAFSSNSNIARISRFNEWTGLGLEGLPFPYAFSRNNHNLAIAFDENAISLYVQDGDSYSLATSLSRGTSVPFGLAFGVGAAADRLAFLEYTPGGSNNRFVRVVSVAGDTFGSPVNSGYPTAKDPIMAVFADDDSDSVYGSFSVAIDEFTSAFSGGPEEDTPEPISGTLDALVDEFQFIAYGGPLVVADIAEIISCSESIADGQKRIAYAADSLSSTASSTIFLVHQLREAVGLAEAFLPATVFNPTAVDVIALSETIAALYDALVSEDLTIEELVLGEPKKVATLVDKIAAADAVAVRHVALAALSIALALRDNAERGIPADISILMQIDDDTVARAAVIAGILTDVVLAADAQAIKSAAVVSAEVVSILSSAQAGQTLSALAESNATFDVVVFINGEMYIGWVVNAETMAPSRYGGFSFDSMCGLNGLYYGANGEGVFRLDGDTDNGDPIEARILTGELDFGSEEIKRVEQAFIGYTANGDLVMKVTATHAGKRTEYWYRAANPVPGDPTETRVVPGKGLVSRYFQFELCNVDGADFEIDKMRMVPVALSRRL